jgi:beta-carotene hydroxylase
VSPTPEITPPLTTPPEAHGTLGALGARWAGPSSAALAGNPTVWLFALALALDLTGVVGYSTSLLPPALVVVVISMGLYVGFTVLHDAVHGVAHADSRVARVMGTVTGFLLTFTYPFFLRVHRQHHGHANDSGRDPDGILGAVPLLIAPFVGGAAIFTSYHANYFRRHWWRSAGELIEVAACDAFYLGILAGAILGGWLTQLMILWVGPLIVTLHVLVFTFDFLPHFPHDSTDRRFNARAYGGRMVALLHLNQNYHMIHHLWPRIPWFRYREAYLATRPTLHALGCRVSWTVTPLPADDRDLARASRAEIADDAVRGDLAGPRRQRDAAGPDRRLAAGVQTANPAPHAERLPRHVGPIPTEAGGRAER